MTITINNNSPRAQYSASGGQTNFAGTWRIEAEADIKVYLTPVGNSPDDTTDILILTTDYTITGVGVGNSFTVILNSGATTGDFITIVADINFGAEYNFQINQNFNPADFDEIFSKFDRELKQLRMETRKLQVKYQNSEQVIDKDYKLPQLAANQSWQMNDVNDEIEAVIIGDTGPGEQWYGVTSGVNTFLATITDFIGYTTGETIYLKFGSSNTAASTININGLGGKNLLKNDGSPVQQNDLLSGTTYVFIYIINQYHLLGIQRATEAHTGISQIATTAEVQAGTNDFAYVTPKKLRQDHPGNVFFVNTSGPANVYTATVPGIATYTNLAINTRINTTSTGASTININGLGAKNIKRSDGSNIGSGDLVATDIYYLVYNGTEFRITNIPKASDTSYGMVKAQEVAKAWVKFNGTTGAILDSYNVSSVTRLGLGLYAINLAITMANTNYCVTNICSEPGTGIFHVTPNIYLDSVSTTVCQIRIIGWNVIGNAVGNTDVGVVCVNIHGRLS